MSLESEVTTTTNDLIRGIIKLKKVLASYVPHQSLNACLLEPLTPNTIVSLNTYHRLSHELLANLLLLNHEDCVIHWMPSKQTQRFK